MPDTDLLETLRIEGVSVKYGNRTVLHACSLDVCPGQLIALVGHNGAGKTTLLRTLCGLAPLVAGTITFGRHQVQRSSTAARARLGLGLVPDAGKGAIFGPLTVSENLQVARELSAGGIDVSDDDLRSIFPAIFDHLDRPVADLSGGQRQMVAIAMALARGPRLLLLDEPSVGLAPLLVAEVMEALRRVADHFGIGVLVVEQNVLAALRLVDQIAVMKQGSIIRECTPAEINDVQELWALF